MWKKYCDDCRNINSDDAFTGTSKTSTVLMKPYDPLCHGIGVGQGSPNRKLL